MDSAVGLDGVPYSLFKVPFPWWQRTLLEFFNLVLSWGVCPTKRSIVVPVLQTGRHRSRHQLSGPFPRWTAHLFPSRRLPGRIPMGC